LVDPEVEVGCGANAMNGSPRPRSFRSLEQGMLAFHTRLC
jgi:hypothetical protein